MTFAHSLNQRDTYEGVNTQRTPSLATPSMEKPRTKLACCSQKPFLSSIRTSKTRPGRQLVAAKHTEGRARWWRGGQGREQLLKEVLAGLDLIPQGPGGCLMRSSAHARSRAQTWASVPSHCTPQDHEQESSPWKYLLLGARQSAQAAALWRKPLLHSKARGEGVGWGRRKKEKDAKKPHMGSA